MSGHLTTTTHNGKIQWRRRTRAHDEAAEASCQLSTCDN